MTIHHATVKSAASKGYILAQEDDAVSAHHPQTNTKVVISTEGFDSDTDAAKEAWATCGDLVDFKHDDANSAWRVFTPTEPDDSWTAEYAPAGSDEPETLDDYASWVDLLEAIRAYEPEAVEAEDEGEEDRGSVVPSSFKAKYKEIGVRKQDNGDFLARIMADHCVILDGKAEIIDCEKVDLLASRNGVDYPLESYSGFISGTRGWQGRFRMTVGNMLRKRVADSKVCVVPASLNKGTERSYEAPEDFISKYATKPKTKASAKEAAAAAAELASDEQP